VLVAPAARTIFSERDRSSEALARTLVHYRPGSALSLAFDAEGAYNRLDTQSALAFNDYPIPLPDGDARVDETRGEIGAVATWRATPALELEAGLHQEVSRIEARSDTDLIATYRFLKPSLHLNWSPTARRQLRLRAERHVGQLGLSNFVAAASLDKGLVSAGNTALRPDSAWIAEIAHEWRSTSRLSVLLTYRHSWLRDVIDRVPVRASGSTVASFDAPGNIGSGHEDLISLDATVPLNSLFPMSQLKVSTTYRRARVTDPQTGERRPTSGLKPVIFTADYHQDLPRFSGAWGATLDAGWRTRTYLFNEVDTDKATALLTVFVDWTPSPNLALHLEVSDVLGRDYRRGVDRYDGPRGFAPLAYDDRRRLRLGPAILLRARRSF
jgi:outer membrane receptor protein involved in Fe transport